VCARCFFCAQAGGGIVDAMTDLKTSEGRLWALIAERAKAAEGKTDDIDRRIWDLFGESWAVMFTDLSGFSRQVETFGILHFLQIIYEHKILLEPVIQAHDGVLIKTEADSLLILFRRAQSAVQCGVAMQRVLEDANKTRPPETKVLLCVGIGYGPILRIGSDDVYGKEVNAASKLGEDTAKAKEILVTRAAKEAAGALPGLSYEKLDVKVAGSDENFKLVYG
jgi:adenylate cyclase